MSVELSDLRECGAPDPISGFGCGLYAWVHDDDPRMPHKLIGSPISGVQWTTRSRRVRHGKNGAWGPWRNLGGEDHVGL